MAIKPENIKENYWEVSYTKLYSPHGSGGIKVFNYPPKCAYFKKKAEAQAFAFLLRNQADMKIHNVKSVRRKPKDVSNRLGRQDLGG